MIELDMVYVTYFGDFLSIGSREFFKQNILFRLSPPRKACRQPRKLPGRQEMPPGRPEKPAGLAA